MTSILTICSRESDSFDGRKCEGKYITTNSNHDHHWKIRSSRNYSRFSSVNHWYDRRNDSWIYRIVNNFQAPALEIGNLWICVKLRESIRHMLYSRLLEYNPVFITHSALENLSIHIPQIQKSPFDFFFRVWSTQLFWRCDIKQCNSSFWRSNTRNHRSFTSSEFPIYVQTVP
jgi:hypothetical protein